MGDTDRPDQELPLYISRLRKCALPCYTCPYGGNVALSQEAKQYTYADFLGWDENARAELVDGEVVMLGAPSTNHQGVLTELLFQIRNYLEGKPCRVFVSPYAVRLNPQENNGDDTVLEPDLVVICDSAKIEKHGCRGAPDMIVEIISPSSASYDRVVKFRKYQQGKVREYWIVDPETKTVQVCVLNENGYLVTIYDHNESVPVAALPGCTIALGKIFAQVE